jgi:hypothetical protein
MGDTTKVGALEFRQNASSLLNPCFIDFWYLAAGAARSPQQHPTSDINAATAADTFTFFLFFLLFSSSLCGT